MTETKLHYKLYKTKHGWVTATIAATALAIPIISGSVTNHASADTTATTGTQTVTSGSNAVTATTASATSATSNTQSVTPDSSKLDQAVQNAKSTANVTVNQTPTQTVTGSTVAEAKQKAEQDYSSQAATINQKVANQKANNDATNAANSFNMDNAKKRELDQAVQNAKSTANVTVNQTQTQIYNTNASGVENTKNKINNDYSTQINNINQAVSAQKAKNDAYNKAVAEANTLNKSTADTTRKNLDDAIKAAQAVKGVTLIDDGTSTSTVSVSDFEAKKKQIQDQNTQQANSINAQIQQYKDIYTKWEKDNQQFLEAAAAKTGWSVQQVLDFLGKDLPNVSYVSAGSNMTFDKGSLQSFSQSELNSILSNPKVDPGLKGYISSKAYGNLYKLSQGVSWKYNNAFTDTKSGKSVDLKVTVQGLGLDYSGRYGLPPMIMVGEKYIGSDVAGIGAVKYGLTFLEHGTNIPINITSLIGVGDVDAKQSVAVYNATSALRGSENKNYSGDDYLGSINTNGIDDFSEGKNTQYQSWFLVPNSSTISYVFSAADPAWGNVAPDGSGFMGFYHQNLGGIPLPIKNTPPTPPTVKYNHTNVALEKPTPTEVTYHYDTIMPATIPGGTPISYHYNEISVPIPNPTKKADKEGKTLIAGDESTQHISQYTGVNQKLDKFAVGDAIQYTNDGRLPVSFDLSRWTVTTSNGANVTAQGKFTQYDKTFEGKKYHVVSWSPTNVSSLKDNETYTLNTVLKTLNDGITDGEIDRAVGGGDGVTFGEAHGYDEFNPTTDKHWVEGSQKVDGKTYIDGDTIHGQVTMTLPDKNSLAKVLSTVQIIDDYSKFADKVDYKSAQVLENGKDVTSEYNISNAYGQVVATRKNAGATPSGNVVLNVTWTIHKDVKSGTQLVNSGSGRINSHTVPTPDRNIVTYKQDTEKHWRDDGGQIVDGKIYVNGSTAHAQVNMTLPDQTKLINKLSNVSIDDDYSKFAKLVDYKSAKVLENGKDVTSEYSIKNANGHVTAVRKDASKTPAGNVQLLVDFEIHKDVKSGTELVNAGSGTLNKNTVPTNTPSITTYTPDGEKHWVLDNNVTDNEIYFSGDKAVAQVSVDLPDASKLATPLNKLVLVDNYSDFADKVKLDNAKVLENGKDVTSEYDLTNKDGKVVATRKEAAKTPSGKAVLVTTFTINNGVENATALHNKGSVTVDSITDEVPDTPIVVFTPQAHKDVELGGDVKGDTENSVDGSLILNGSVVTYPITTSDLPAERAEDITKRVVKDTLDKNAEFVGFKAWVENDKGELEDVTSHYKLDKNGQDLTFTEDSYLLGLYNKDKSKQTHTPIIDLVVKVKGDAQKITNKATVLTNDNVTETNEVSVDTPAKPTPTKVDKNEKGVNIDGKNVLPGSVNNYELTMDLSKFKGIKVTDQDLAKGFYFVDDYPEKALDVDPQTFTSKTVDGKTVKGLSAKVYQSLSEVPSDVAAVLKANNITPKGAFVLISADNPAQFFKDYVETGTNITVNAPMKVKAGFAGKYENKAWQLTFGQGEATDIVSNNVPKIDPKKDIVISADNRTSLNNHTIELGQNFDYLLKGGILDKDQGHDIYEYKWIDDYDQNHDQYNGQFIAPLTVDVALKDGTVLKAGTDISNHVSQNIDTKTGSVEFSVDKDFLDKVDFDKGGFAADILMSVKRIKAGEVDNTYTNIINGQKFGSNTVHSTTPEPKTPESPALPQMGETNDTLAEEVVGFAAIVAALGMAGTSLKKRKD